jgi:hypothetical protein
VELTGSPEYARGGDSGLTRTPPGRLARDAWWIDRFENRDLEWRRLVAEAVGTFLLVLAATGASVVAAASHIAISRAAAVSAPGLTVLAVILSMGAISGAHLNPAVSLAFAARGDFPWRRVPGYVVAQLFGATLAVLFVLACRPSTAVAPFVAREDHSLRAQSDAEPGQAARWIIAISSSRR